MAGHVLISLGIMDTAGSAYIDTATASTVPPLSIHPEYP
jgi:hypothetical protein